VASASIAQVHFAVLRDGRDVAVKVLRPGMLAAIDDDVELMRRLARAVERWSPDGRRLKPRQVVAEFDNYLHDELDLVREAANASQLRRNMEPLGLVLVPEMVWELCTQEVLVMQRMHGVPISQVQRLRDAGVDIRKLARDGVTIFFTQVFRDGFFHADMHPGNLFVDDAGSLIAVDFGIMGRLGPNERRFLAEILYGFITRNYRRTAEVHFEAGYVPSRHSVDSFAQAIRAIGEPIHNRPASEISMAKLLTLLFEITGLFDMRTRLELLLLQKTMVVAEGVARSLDPNLDMWATAEPVVRQWVERHLGPAGRIEEAAEGAVEVGRFLGGVPGLLARGARIADQLDTATRDGLVLSPDTVKAIGAAEARRNRWTAVALWVIAGLLAWLVIWGL
ncbi:MAG: ubiquinone biosynthesis protein UbiB, partial [Bradyrhizobiaceae bacterium]|nr:ubiquinone biosynthesis protein UbiB [Bradyrhizobiaceae bacterium]